MPSEIASQLVEIEVQYIDSKGKIRTGIIEMNQKTEDDIRAFFSLAFDLRFPIDKIVRSSDDPYSWSDDALLDANATSGFNYRLIKGTSKISLHGQGLAFDVNTRTNPYIRFENGKVFVDPKGAFYDPHVPGTLFAGHPLVELMKSRGWEWGGDWTKESGRIDYQHFQKI